MLLQFEALGKCPCGVIEKLETTAIIRYSFQSFWLLAILAIANNQGKLRISK